MPTAQTGLPQAASAASAGIGFRVNFNPYIFGTGEMAKPLTRDVATYQNKSPRFFVSLTFTGKTPSSGGENATPPPPVAAGYGTGAATNGPVAQVVSSTQ